MVASLLWVMQDLDHQQLSLEAAASCGDSWLAAQWVIFEKISLESRGLGLGFRAFRVYRVYL